MKEASTASVLVVEDDEKLRSLLEQTFRFEGYDVTSCADGAAGLEALTDAGFDAVVLDVSMPHINGLEMCRRMRDRSRSEPILLLTARTTISDRVAGLDAGADDYLVKPFSIEELLARVRALLRRPPPAVDSAATSIQVGELMLDTEQRRCWYPDTAVELTKIEFDLLAVLATNKEIVIERGRLYELVWGYHFVPESRTLDATISYLRRKIELPDRPRLIHTMRGIGYVIREPR